MQIPARKAGKCTDPRAESRLLMSFLTFHIWIFCSAVSVLILGNDVCASYEGQEYAVDKRYVREI